MSFSVFPLAKCGTIRRIYNVYRHNGRFPIIGDAVICRHTSLAFSPPSTRFNAYTICSLLYRFCFIFGPLFGGPPIQIPLPAPCPVFGEQVKFKKIYKKEFKQKVSDAEVTEMGLRLLRLFDLLFRNSSLPQTKRKPLSTSKRAWPKASSPGSVVSQKPSDGDRPDPE